MPPDIWLSVNIYWRNKAWVIWQQQTAGVTVTVTVAQEVAASTVSGWFWFCAAAAAEAASAVDVGVDVNIITAAAEMAAIGSGSFFYFAAAAVTAVSSAKPYGAPSFEGAFLMRFSIVPSVLPLRPAWLSAPVPLLSLSSGFSSAPLSTPHQFRIQHFHL